MKLGDWIAVDFAPFNLMVVDVSECGRFLTAALGRHERNFLVTSTGRLWVFV